MSCGYFFLLLIFPSFVCWVIMTIFLNNRRIKKNMKNVQEKHENKEKCDKNDKNEIEKGENENENENENEDNAKKVFLLLRSFSSVVFVPTVTTRKSCR